jgi:hypothetical protein
MNVRIIAGDDPIEQVASHELRRYLELIRVAASTTDPAIHLGMISHGHDTVLQDIPCGGFVIRSTTDGIAIAGSSPRETLFGVYAFLEKLGIRWYFPGEDGEVLPGDSPNPFPHQWDITEEPAFGTRGVIIEHENSAQAEWIDFAAKKRLTTISLHGTQGFDEFRRMATERGLDAEIEMHLLPGGLCSADPDRLATYRDLLSGALKHIPDDIRRLFLWQEDMDRVTCGCDADQGLSVTDTTLRVYNHLAEWLETIRPDARLAFLVYIGTWGLPDRTKPHPRLFAEIAPMQRCMAHAVHDDTCSINRNEVGDTIRRWCDVFDPSDAQVLDYWLDSSLFDRGRYRDNLGRLPHGRSVLQSDLLFYRELGFDAISTFAVGVDRPYLDRWVSPVLFQYPELLWNPDADCREGLGEFAERWFGTNAVLPVLETLELADTQALEHGRPAHVDSALTTARQVASELVDSTAGNPWRRRIRRLADEIDHRISWHDVDRDSDPDTL